MLAKLARSEREVIGQCDLLRRLVPAEFTDQRFGEPTVRDILAELEKPGRDPRGEFVTAHFKEGVESIADLSPGMRLQGVVTNVANFGAFVDIGVHQDGLVHVSQLSDRFVRDPREAVRAGQVVSVTVVEVDAPRRRIALSMKSRPTIPSRSAVASADAGMQAGRGGSGRPAASAGLPAARRPQPAPAEPTALGAALSRAIRR